MERCGNVIALMASRPHRIKTEQKLPQRNFALKCHVATLTTSLTRQSQFKVKQKMTRE